MRLDGACCGIERVQECIAGRLRRPEFRRRTLEYLRRLLSSVGRKIVWQMAAGVCSPALMSEASVSY